MLAAGQATGEVRADRPSPQLAILFVGLLSLHYVQHWGSDGAWPAMDDIPDLVTTAFWDGAAAPAAAAGDRGAHERSTMSTYVYMKLLESAPERYDAGIRRCRAAASRTSTPASPSAPPAPAAACSTSAAAPAASPWRARRAAPRSSASTPAPACSRSRAARPPAARPAGAVELVELGAMEIEDRFGEASFDAVVSCLVMSELLPEERRYVLATARSRLRPGGVAGDRRRGRAADPVAARRAAASPACPARRGPTS